jgi:hypothetical protein
MSAMTELFWFHNLADKEIDGALQAVAAEGPGTAHHEYTVSAHTMGPIARTSCSLSITHSNPTKPSLKGDFVVSAVGDKVQVSQSFDWEKDGALLPLATFDRQDVTAAEITKLAHEFRGKFFADLP